MCCLRSFEKSVFFNLLSTIYWTDLCSFKMLVIKEKMFILETTCLVLKTSMVTASMENVNSSILLRRLLVGKLVTPDQRWETFHQWLLLSQRWTKYCQNVVFICSFESKNKLSASFGKNWKVIHKNRYCISVLKSMDLRFFNIMLYIF